MSLTIRGASVPDAPALMGVFQSSVRGLGPRAYSARQIEAWVNAMAPLRHWEERLQSRNAWLAEADDAIVGWIEMDGWHIDMFYCVPELSGKGVAAALYGHAELHQRAQHAPQMRTDASDLLRPFLERRHWQVNRREIAVRDGVEIQRSRMSKQLAGETDAHVRSFCERCFRAFPSTAHRYACSHGCSFCGPCMDELASICPNCNGKLVAVN